MVYLNFWASTPFSHFAQFTSKTTTDTPVIMANNLTRFEAVTGITNPPGMEYNQPQGYPAMCLEILPLPPDGMLVCHRTTSSHVSMLLDEVTTGRGKNVDKVSGRSLVFRSGVQPTRSNTTAPKQSESLWELMATLPLWTWSNLSKYLVYLGKMAWQ